MNLNLKPENVQWPAAHYLFVEKVGPFQTTARQAWELAHSKKSEISAKNKISSHMSLYKMDPEMVYRAGFVVDTKPEKIPDGFKYEKLNGGAYSKFVLTGSYSNLPEACGKVFETVDQLKISIRDDFFIENYVNDPSTAKEDQLVTEILIPRN